MLLLPQNWSHIILFYSCLYSKKWWHRVRLRECISAVFWRNLIKHALNLHPSVFNSFHMTLIHGESHRIFTSPPPYGISPHFTQNFFLLLPHHFFYFKSFQKMSKILISSEKCRHTPFFCFKENSFFWKLSHFFPTLELSPKGTCSLNRPSWSYLNGIKASTVLFIKDFFFWWSPYFPAFEPRKNVYATSISPEKSP